MERWNVGILLFPEVEVLDFAGPFEVFSRTRLTGGIASRLSEEAAPFSVFTLARTAEPVRATGGLVVVPTYAFADLPAVDLLVVPGGLGTRPLTKDAEMLDFLRGMATRVRRLAGVCTGSLLLAKAGLLDGRRATTHWASLDHLGKLGRDLTVERDQRVVDDGIITSGGVSAGIDMALYVVEILWGREVADETAHYMEYRR